ncbi:hypothetical protein [Sphingomonas profundi]|uniref:hypothetical protein n=1 Tax=Alterirhizorhabdus profundi TaxID=2681549 RepID=UPI0012E702EA|nr:hypothetical protein [Sphingomonas profundi]
MTDDERSRATAQAHVALYHVTTLILAALVDRGVLAPAEAAGIVRDAAHTLEPIGQDSELLMLWRERYEQVAEELAAAPPGKPLQPSPFPSYALQWGRKPA